MSDGAMITLPVLPLRDIVVFPHMIVPLFVGREKSIRALEAVMAEDKQIILVTQKEADTEDPDADGLYTCLLYTSPSPRDISGSRMPSSA